MENLDELRGYCVDDSPITPTIIKDWCQINHKKPPKWEIDAYIGLDRTLRQARFDVTMYHADRDRAKAENKAKMNGGRSTTF